MLELVNLEEEKLYFKGLNIIFTKYINREYIISMLIILGIIFLTFLLQVHVCTCNFLESSRYSMSVSSCIW